MKKFWNPFVRQCLVALFGVGLLGVSTAVSGQTYVALSRCTTLEGLVLPAMPTARAITVAPEVQAFMAATIPG